MKTYAHQQKIIDEDPKKCGLFLGTGSGKTRIALLLAKGSTLVIAPKTQVEDGNWEREYNTLLFKGKVNFGPRHSLTVISKETFRRDHESLPVFDTVIVDEAHTCLGVTPNTRQRQRKTIPLTSQIFEALDTYIARTKPARIYLCTATIMRSPMTVWGAAKILGKHFDFIKFRDRFYTRLPMGFREVYTAKRDPRNKDFLAKIVRDLGYVGRLDDFFDVPEQIWHTDYVTLTAKQEKRIKQLPQEYPDPIVLLMKRHQVENGVLAGDEFNDPEFFENGKIDKILDYAEEFPRIVVFARYRAQIEQIATALRKAGKNVLTLTGDTKERGGVISEAAGASKCVFVCQASISAGWELKEYPVMIFASRDYQWVNFDQAKGRIQRADRIKKNLYIKLIARTKNSVDDAVDFSLENKEDFNERIYLGIKTK